MQNFFLSSIYTPLTNDNVVVLLISFSYIIFIPVCYRSNNFTVLAGNEVYALLCMKLTQRTANKYTYFILSSEYIIRSEFNDFFY